MMLGLRLGLAGAAVCWAAGKFTHRCDPSAADEKSTSTFLCVRFRLGLPSLLNDPSSSSAAAAASQFLCHPSAAAAESPPLSHREEQPPPATTTEEQRESAEQSGSAKRRPRRRRRRRSPDRSDPPNEETAEEPFRNGSQTETNGADEPTSAPTRRSFVGLMGAWLGWIFKRVTDRVKENSNTSGPKGSGLSRLTQRALNPLTWGRILTKLVWWAVDRVVHTIIKPYKVIWEAYKIITSELK